MMFLHLLMMLVCLFFAILIRWSPLATFQHRQPISGLHCILTTMSSALMSALSVVSVVPHRRDQHWRHQGHATTSLSYVLCWVTSSVWGGKHSHERHHWKILHFVGNASYARTEGWLLSLQHGLLSLEQNNARARTSAFCFGLMTLTTICKCLPILRLLTWA